MPFTFCVKYLSNICVFQYSGKVVHNKQELVTRMLAKLLANLHRNAGAGPYCEEGLDIIDVVLGIYL